MSPTFFYPGNRIDDADSDWVWDVEHLIDDLQLALTDAAIALDFFDIDDRIDFSV